MKHFSTDCMLVAREKLEYSGEVRMRFVSMIKINITSEWQMAMGLLE